MLATDHLLHSRRVETGALFTLHSIDLWEYALTIGHL